ncbi:MAG: hypothetical protein RIE52_11980 [Balneola sp.]
MSKPEKPTSETVLECYISSVSEQEVLNLKGKWLQIPVIGYGCYKYEVEEIKEAWYNLNGVIS